MATESRSPTDQDSVRCRSRNPTEAPAVATAHAGIDERKLHVVQCRRARQQVEGLEDEPDLLVANPCQLVV